MMDGSKQRRAPLPTLEEAEIRWLAAIETVATARSLQAESVPLAEAFGRITATPIHAAISSPHYTAVAMDGVAVIAADTEGATESHPIHLQIGVQATWVNTGDPVPPGADAVIMVEDVRRDGDAIEITRPAPRGQHVRAIGEDIVVGELVLPEGFYLGPVELGAIAASGYAAVTVSRRPRVAILPTGSELVAPGAPLEPGDVIELNSLMLAAQVQEWGSEPTRLPSTADDYELIKATVSEALQQFDAVVVIAGSSAGSKDYTAAVFRELGEVIVHGVAIRPGRPVVLGIACGTAVLGLPGYPVAAFLTAELFLSPLIHRLLGAHLRERPRVSATFTCDVQSSRGEDEFLRVQLARAGDRLLASPLSRGAGAITSLARADALVRIPQGIDRLSEGTMVQAELLRSLQEIQVLS